MLFVFFVPSRLAGCSHDYAIRIAAVTVTADVLTAHYDGSVHVVTVAVVGIVGRMEPKNYRVTACRIENRCKQVCAAIMVRLNAAVAVA